MLYNHHNYPETWFARSLFSTCPLGPFSALYGPTLCPGCQPLQVSSSARAFWLTSGSQSRMKVQSGIYSPISVSWGPELPFSPSTQLLVRAPFWKPPHPLKLPVIVPVLVTSDMGVTLPTMFYLPLLSALTFAYTLVISPSLNSVSYFEYAVNFLDSEQYWTTISLF